MFTSFFYGTEACPITSLEFTVNKVLYKIFGAMSKDSYGEICKYFGIDKVEESIRHRQEKFVKRYSGYQGRNRWGIGGGPDPQLFGGPQLLTQCFCRGVHRQASRVNSVYNTEEERRHSSYYYCRYYPRNCK